MNVDQTCRICLCRGEMKPIFSTSFISSIKISCAEAILQITSVPVQEDDGLPKNICKRCFNKLKSAYKLKLRCQKSYGKLIRQIKNKDIDNDNDDGHIYEGDSLDDEFLFKMKVENIKKELNFSDPSELQSEENINASKRIPKEDLTGEKIPSDLQAVKNSDEAYCVKNILEAAENTDLWSSNVPKKHACRKTKRKKLKNKYQCDICGKLFNRKDNLRVHILAQLGSRGYVCHKRKSIDKTYAICETLAITKPVHQCKTCNKTFQQKSNLKKHELAHIGIKGYFCEMCQKSFSSESAHRSFHESLECSQCGRVFKTGAGLDAHTRLHTHPLPFPCTHPGCQKAFPKPSRLQMHLTTHTDERNFICQYCSHAARNKKQLTIHIRYHHTKEKNYVCDTCGKAFVTLQDRNIHARRHDETRDYFCTLCTKSFKFDFDLRNHLIIHSSEKRFGCSFCESRFHRKQHKEKHESRVHNIDRSDVKSPFSSSSAKASKSRRIKLKSLEDNSLPYQIISKTTDAQPQEMAHNTVVSMDSV